MSEHRMNEVAQAADFELERRNQTIDELRAQLEIVTADRDHLREALKPNCIKCDAMHESGNCTATGGFCTAVLAAHCPLIPKLQKQLELVTKQRDALFKLLNEVCQNVREKHVDDSVCGLCEYDGAHIGESGDWESECPGFDADDCFCIKKSLRQKYGQEE